MSTDWTQKRTLEKASDTKPETPVEIEIVSYTCPPFCTQFTKKKKKNTQEKQVVLACFYKICYNNGQESDKPSDSRVSYEPQHTYRTNAVPGYSGTAFFTSSVILYNTAIPVATHAV